MTDKVLLITPPDDSLVDGLRILLIDLQPEQTQIISDSFFKIESIPMIVTYIWKNGDDIDWLLDKKHKSDLIIFNADSDNQTIVGYAAAQRNSHYFGTLRSLTSANNSAIYNVEQLIEILKRLIEKYEI